MTGTGKQAAFLLVLLFMNLLVAAQKSTIRGTVVDKHSKATLPGANVVLLETDPPVGTSTDIDGRFKLEEVPVGRVGIRISYLGYNPVILNNLNLNSGKELVLNIELEERVMVSEEVAVVANKRKDKALNEMATVSARTFSVEETQRYAGSMNDVARMASNFAGVQSANDSRNDIIIRGNSSLGVMYRLDGVEIPNPNHFGSFGTTAGPVSILNNNLLSNSDFFTGAFPAEYGNAIAGIFDLKMRKGNSEQHEFTGQVGFNGAELLAEGPFSRSGRSSYLISYRYSTLDLFKAMGVSFGTLAVPKYQDLSFKMHFPYKKGSIAVIGIGGISNIEMLDSDIDTANNAWGEQGENLWFGSRLGAAAIVHTHLISSKTYIKTVLSNNFASSRIKTDTLSAFDQTGFPYYRNNSRQNKQSVNSFLNKKFNAKHVVKAGAIVDRYQFNLSDSVYNPRFDQYLVLSDFDGSAWMARPYIQWQYRITNNFSFTSGLHYSHFLYNNSQSTEPRAGIKWIFKDLNTLSLGYGLHSQLQPFQVYFDQVQIADGSYQKPNTDVGFTKSHHFVVGYDRRLSENMRLKTEAYYQQIFNVPVDIHPNSYSMLNQGADFSIYFPDTLANEGTGTNYGGEFTIEHFLSKGFYFLTTGALFTSKYKGSDGEERSSVFDSNYSLNLLFGKEFVIGGKDAEKEGNKRKVLFMDARFVMNGGQRYTPIDVEASKALARPVYEEEKIFANKYDDYLRLDMNLGFRINGQKATQEWLIYLQNATNRKNIFRKEFNPETSELETIHQIGILPVMQYKIEF